MPDAILTSILSFVSTNLDDILMLTLFWSQCSTLRDRLHVLFGQYLGIACLTVLSLLGARGLQFLPMQYLNFLGLLPIALGVKAFLAYRKDPTADTTEEETPFTPNILPIALVVIAGGGDNIGLYIPLFAGFSASQTLCALFIFALLTALWCCFAAILTRLPFIRNALQNYARILVPTVLVALGFYILIE